VACVAQSLTGGASVHSGEPMTRTYCARATELLRASIRNCTLGYWAADVPGIGTRCAVSGVTDFVTSTPGSGSMIWMELSSRSLTVGPDGGTPSSSTSLFTVPGRSVTLYSALAVTHAPSLRLVERIC